MPSSTNGVRAIPATAKRGLTLTVPTKRKFDRLPRGGNLPFQNSVGVLSANVRHLHILFTSCEEIKNDPLFENPQHLVIGPGDYLHKSIVRQWEAGQDCVLWGIVEIAGEIYSLSAEEMEALWKDLVSDLDDIGRMAVKVLALRRQFSEMKRYIPGGSQSVPQVMLHRALVPLETANWEQISKIFEDCAKLEDLEKEAGLTPSETTLYDFDVEIDSEEG